MQLQEDLLARHLRRDQTLGSIGELILRKEPGPHRQAGGEMPFHILHTVSLETGDHEYGIKTALPRERVGEAEQPVAADQIDLVQREDRSAAAFPQSAEDAAGVLVDAARSVDQQQGLSGLLRPTMPRPPSPGRAAPRHKDPGSIHIDNLRRVLDRDPRIFCASLRLWCDDREFVANEPVEKGRFPRIGRPDQRDIAAACRALARPPRQAACCLAQSTTSACVPTRRPGAIWRGG